MYAQNISKWVPLDWALLLLLLDWLGVLLRELNIGAKNMELWITIQ